MILTHFEEWLGAPVEVQPLAEKADPRGEEYGRDYFPEGEAFKVYWRKLGAREQFQMGKSDVTYAFRFYYPHGEAEHPLPVTEQMRLRFFDWPLPPEWSEDYIDLNVFSVDPNSYERVTLIDAERTF